MVKRIQSNEYLKRYDNMTSQEREEYESRVGQWLSDNADMLAEKGDCFEARMQNVQQVSTSWNDQECLAFEDGVRLLSAMVPTTDTWLPDMLYIKSAKRSIKRMIEILSAVTKPVVEVGKTGDVDTASETVTEEQQQNIIEKYSVDEKPEKQPDIVDSFQGNAGDGAITGDSQNGEAQVDIVPARPKHIDQYVHLLPQKTQEHAALVQGLYRELEEARQKLDLLMNNKTSSAADRETWAKKATKCDNTLRKIFDELDAEWAKLVKAGRVVVDDLGNARVISSPQKDEAQEPAELTSEQKARRRELRKWLTDTRRGNGAGREDRVKQWKVNFKEYLTLEGNKAFEDEKIIEAAKHYEIDMKDLNWPPLAT